MALPLTDIFISRHWFEAATTSEGVHHLPAAVVDFVNDVQKTGLFVHTEIPAEAWQVYYADYYRATIERNGHIALWENTDGWKATTSHGSSALAAIGATRQLACLEEIARLFEHADTTKRPGKAIFSSVGMGYPETTTEYESIVKERPDRKLLELDKKFDAAERAEPLTRLLASWIKNWPNLKVVEPENYTNIIESLAASNPHRPARKILASVEQIKRDLNNPFHLSRTMTAEQAKVSNPNEYAFLPQAVVDAAAPIVDLLLRSAQLDTHVYLSEWELIDGRLWLGLRTKEKRQVFAVSQDNLNALFDTAGECLVRVSKDDIKRHEGMLAETRAQVASVPLWTS